MTVTDYDGNTINIEETRKGAGKMSGHAETPGNASGI